MSPDDMITLSSTGPDWPGAPHYYAQRGSKLYGFGTTPTKALMNLWKQELNIPVEEHKEWHGTKLNWRTGS